MTDSTGTQSGDKLTVRFPAGHDLEAGPYAFETLEASAHHPESWVVWITLPSSFQEPRNGLLHSEVTIRLPANRGGQTVTGEIRLTDVQEGRTVIRVDGFGKLTSHAPSS